MVQYIFRPRKPEGSLGRTAQRTATSTLTQLLNYDSRPLFFFHVALRPRRRDGILGTGTEYEWEGDDRRWRLDRGNRPKKTGETVDRRQNNGTIVLRRCPLAIAQRLSCALRICCFNCCACMDSHKNNVRCTAVDEQLGQLEAQKRFNLLGPVPPPYSWSLLGKFEGPAPPPSSKISWSRLEPCMPDHSRLQDFIVWDCSLVLDLTDTLMFVHFVTVL